MARERSGSPRLLLAGGLALAGACGRSAAPPTDAATALRAVLEVERLVTEPGALAARAFEPPLPPEPRVPDDVARWLAYRREHDAELARDFDLRRLALCRALNDDPWSAPATVDALARELGAEGASLRARLARAVRLADLADELGPSAAGAGTLEGLVAACDAVREELDLLRAPVLEALGPEGLDFLPSWIARTGATYRAASREAAPWELAWRATHADPFGPGEPRTRGGLDVPDVFPSMTSAYHALARLAGSSHRSRGVTDRDLRVGGVHATFDGLRLEPARLARALALLVDHLEASSLDELARALERLPGGDGGAPDVEGDVLWFRETAFGGLVVGGPGPNRYGPGAPAVVIDVGGDDEHAARARPSERALSLVIDLQGDDVYRAPGDAVGGPGGGLVGLGLVVDRAGNDRYLAGGADVGAEELVARPRRGGGPAWIDPSRVFGAPGFRADGGFALGGAFHGIGIVVDEAGDDLYAGDKLAFGAALGPGLGLVLDGSGRDVGLAANLALGSGCNGGVGVFLGLGDGDDVYQVWGLYRFLDLPPDGLAPGFTSFGLGAGSAWRVETRTRAFENTPAGPGGVGLLLDARGNDVYVGGNCHQGTGYGGGVGALVDREGNDRHVSLRGDPSGAAPAAIAGAHGIGDAAHLGTGVLWNGTGDDEYVVGEQGGGYGWDAGAGFLIDLVGADVYRGAGLDGAPLVAGAASAGAQALGLLLDGGGADRLDPSCARLGDASDHHVDYLVPGGNLALLVLLGDEPRRVGAVRLAPGGALRVAAVQPDGTRVPFGFGALLHLGSSE